MKDGMIVKEAQLKITFTDRDIEFLRGLILQGKDHEGLFGHIVEEYENLEDIHWEKHL
jgi:hypothetical protein